MDAHMSMLLNSVLSQNTRNDTSLCMCDKLSTLMPEHMAVLRTCSQPLTPSMQSLMEYKWWSTHGARTQPLLSLHLMSLSLAVSPTAAALADTGGLQWVGWLD